MDPGPLKAADVVVVADDFGRSPAVNHAIIEAHDMGIVTAASIMPGGEAFDEAVGIARSSRRLSVGLHLTLCDGTSVLPRSAIPDLVDRTGGFEKSPSRAWIRYSQARMLPQLEREIEAQFLRLKKAGIQPTHVDSHHHVHMQPSVFSLLLRHASRERVPWVRVPREPLSFRSRGRGAMPLIEWIVFAILAVSHKKKIRLQGLQTAGCVYGLSRTGHLDEKYLLKILNRVEDSRRADRTEKRRIVEIFTHPDTETMSGRRELEALTSPMVRGRIALPGINLLGYRELSERVVPDG